MELEMLETQWSQKIRQFKRSAWRHVPSAKWYHKTVDKPSVGTEREKKIISRYAKGLILDAGAGSGRITNHLRTLNKSVIALDISVEMLARQVECGSNICGDVEALPFKNETFDTVNATWVLVHFPNWKEIVRELVRVLKIGGTILFEMGSKEHLNWAKEILPDIEKKYSSAQAYESFETVDEIYEELRINGVRIDQVIPYDFLNSNEFLKFLCGQNESCEKQLFNLLSTAEAIDFWCRIEEDILSSFPPGMSHKNFFIANKIQMVPLLDRNYVNVNMATNLNEAARLAMKIIGQKKEQLLLIYLDVHYYSTLYSKRVRRFHRKLTEIFSQFLPIDPISIASQCKKETLLSELKQGHYHGNFKKDYAYEDENINILRHVSLKEEFSYWAEKLVTTWHETPPNKTDISICDVPFGPIMEYELMKEIILQTPSSVYFALDNEGQ